MRLRGTSLDLSLCVGVALALGVSLIDPPYPDLQVLQHVPTVVALGALLWVVHGRRLSRAAVACCAAFLVLHVIGARWIYSAVPYDDAFRALVGSAPADWFGWTRNHYDRFVHLAFGFLAVPPLVEIIERRTLLERGAAVLFALAAVNGLSAVYEIFEWGLTVTVHSETATAYNGQQGDLWDAQKDMALAALGALLAAPWAWFRSPQPASARATAGP